MAFGASAGALFVDVLPRTTGFATALTAQMAPATAKFESGFKATVARIAGQATGLGTSIGAGLGLGLGVAGIAAGKMALDFENAFTRIGAISNASEADIAAWKGQVLDLAGETAIAPKELADALFFLSSAGLESGQVMEALNVSAKAAASGLGSTVDIANVTASALNAYADAGLTATQVTDTLVAAVREGRVEPEQFAAALGRIFPIATAAGVAFSDVTASLAALSNAGLDVNEGVTAMRGALQAIAAPGAQASAAMDELGLSAQDLLDAISEDGLIGAFRLLDERALEQGARGTAAYNDALRKIIPNVRALSGVLNLTSQEATKVDAIFRNVADSVGDGAEAFRETTEGPGFAFRKMLNDLKIAAIQFGEVLIPIGSAVAQVLGPAFRFAGDNAGILLGVLLGYGALKFVPPLLLGIAAAMKAVGAAAVAGQVATFASSLAAAAPKLTLVGLAVAGVALAGKKLNDVLFPNDIDATSVADLWGGKLVAALEAGKISTHEFLVEVDRINEAFEGVSGFTAISGAELLGWATIVSNTRDTVKGAGVEIAGALDAVAEASRQADAALGFGPALAGALSGALDSFQALDQEVARNNIRESLDEASGAFELMGTSATEFLAEARVAFEAGGKQGEEWAALTVASVAEASQAFAGWRSEAVSNLTFVDDALSEFANDADASVGSLAQGFNDAIRDTRDFGRDLQKILRVGGDGADDFAEALLAMGPAGADAADRIAGSSKAMIQQLAGDFATGQTEAESLASRLQTQIVGALTDIRGLLKFLARKWTIGPVDVSGNARSELDAIRAQLIGLTSHTWTADFVLTGRGLDNVPAAAGFHGEVTRPTIFLAGEAGSERVDITPHGGGAQRAPELVGAGVGLGGSGQVRGRFVMEDWHRGLGSFMAEADHADALWGD